MSTSSGSGRAQRFLTSMVTMRRGLFAALVAIVVLSMLVLVSLLFLKVLLAAVTLSLAYASAEADVKEARVPYRQIRSAWPTTHNKKDRWRMVKTIAGEYFGRKMQVLRWVQLLLLLALLLFVVIPIVFTPFGLVILVVVVVVAVILRFR